MKKRMFCLALGLSMALSLAACGSREADPSPTSPAETSVEPTTPATPAPTAEPTPEPSGEPSAPPVEPWNYTLTAVELPQGWEPTGDSNNVAAGWVTIQRREDGRTVEEAIYRADGKILDLAGYFVYGFEHLTSRGSATRLPVLTFDVTPKDEMNLHDGSLWNFYDVEQGRLLLDTGVFEDDPSWSIAWETYHSSPPTWPQIKQDESSGLYGYVDQTENWVIPAQYDMASPFVDGAAVVHFQDITATAIDETGRELLPRRYSELWYLGDGVFNYWGDLSSWDNDDWRQDCGTVTLEGVENPTAAFSGYFNGGLAAHHGLIAMGGPEDGYWAYYDYAGNRVTEDFDWAGPIGEARAGFVCRDGGLFRIQFEG